MNVKRLEDAIAGDGDAFAALLDDNYTFIFSVAWRWCGDKEEAEDVTQDVCLKLARIIKTFRAKSNFKTWLYQVTLNQVRDLKRMQQREKKKTQEFLFETKNMIEDNQEDDQLSENLWKAVRSLPQALCDTVLLIYGEGLNHAQAGEILHCAESTVSWRLMEARKQLKLLMRERDV